MRNVVACDGRVCLGALALVALLGGSPARAQGLEEVVVTAQRRVENLQNVPVAASVFTGDMLIDKGVQGIVALQYAAPSLTVADYGSANVLNIRGIGRSAVDIELPSGVVLYRDGVPTFPGYFQNEPYFDIASIEVLRGPQGTFVGKSAAGGAIFIRTAAPDLSEFSGKVEAEVGDFDQYGGTIIVNAPVTEEFGLRAAYRHLERNEILFDSLTGPFTGRPGRPDLDSLRLGALWAPSDQLSMQARVDLSDLNFGGNLTSSYGYPLFDLVQDINFQYRDKSVRAIGDVKYTFDNDLALSWVSGYQRTHTYNNFDRNGSQPRVNRFESEGPFELWSTELDLISPTDAGPYSYVIGFFVQHTDSVIYDWVAKGLIVTGEAGDLGGFVQGSDYPYLGLGEDYVKGEDEYSVFADVKYHFAEEWELEVGVRYSRYEVTNDTNVVIGNGLTPPTIPFFVGTQEIKEDDVDGKVSVTWEFNPDQNVFVLVARGHVNGGNNIIGGAEFDKEIIYSYEAGWKGTWADGRVRTQLGAYYQTLSDYQAQFASEDLPGQNILQNAQGDSEMYGFEASMQSRLGGFSFDAAIATLDSKLGEFPRVVSPFLPPPDNIISISGGETPFAPELSINVSASYEFALEAAWRLTPRIDISYQSDKSGSLIVAPQTKIAERTLLNGGIRLDNADWYADFFMNNITNERYVAGIQDLGAVWYPGPPRQYGLRIGVAF